jgi:hypothetical protein
MRNFTNATVFDDTDPLADGQMEIGSHLPLDQLNDAMEDRFPPEGRFAQGFAFVSGGELNIGTNLPASVFSCI